MRAMSRTVSLGVAFVLVAVSLGATVQEPVQLARKGKAGTVTRHRTEVKASANGMQMAIEIKEVKTYTVSAVAANGDLTLIDDTESVEVSMNGQAMPADPRMMTKSTIVVRANGSLVSYTKANGTDVQTDVRMFAATNPIFPDTPLKAGDTWSRSMQADAKSGARAARADYEVLAFETADGSAAVKIKMTYTEVIAPALSTSATFWIDRATGDPIKVEGTVQNFPLDTASGVTASLTITQTRIK